jgi:molecular chaperone GrpE
MALKSDEIFAITESPIPLTAWSDDDETPSLERVEREVAALLRASAESRRETTDAERTRAEDVRKLLLQVLDVEDGFERVFRSVQQKQDAVMPQMKIWIGNFRAVSKVVERMLRDSGVTAIQNLDQGFDPAWHQATETVVDPSREDGAIVEVIRKGYLWHGAILRKAEVVIVRNSE